MLVSKIISDRIRYSGLIFPCYCHFYVPEADIEDKKVITYQRLCGV